MPGKVFESVDPDEKPDLSGYVGVDPVYQNAASQAYTPDGKKPKVEKKVKAETKSEADSTEKKEEKQENSPTPPQTPKSTTPADDKK